MSASVIENIQFYKGDFLFFPFFITVFYFLLPVASLASYYFALFNEFPPYLVFGIAVDALPGTFLYYWFMNGFITSARVRLLDKLVGLPALIRLHTLGAMGCLFWIAAHFLLKGMPTSVQAWFGFSAAIVFLLLALSAVTQWVDIPLTHLLNLIPPVRKFHQWSHRNTQYQYQRLKHNFMALAAILVYLHIILSSMAQTDRRFFIVSTVYFMLAFGLYCYHKFSRPLLLRSRELWELKGIQAESDTVTGLEFAALPTGRLFKYRGGQFGFLRFVSGRLRGEEHPFSFSSHPDEPGLSFAIQHDGDFTSRLHTDAAIGDRAVIDGPYGLFFPTDAAKPMLAIAGGIGIVPFISIFKNLQRRPVVEPLCLFWLNRSENTMFQTDMRNFQSIPGAELELFSRRDGRPLTLERLQSVPNLRNLEIFICASRPLTKTILGLLKQAGVRRGRIHYELFSM
ncbi:MAG: hypothetical protein B0D92_02090 [Spirochaeta sp. LUC14_002_19_P3]|nr:MAG: hypothetical protein B0D92_02090 [Spirochaeta sp. LUC14_002_19_P3]